MTTASLTDFLSARLAADEAAARHALAGDLDHLPTVECRCGRRLHVGITNPARVLAQVTAMRAIVELHAPTKQLGDLAPVCESCLTDRAGYSDDWGPDRWPCSTLTALASIWADDPEFQEAWR